MWQIPVWLERVSQWFLTPFLRVSVSGSEETGLKKEKKLDIS